MKITNDTRAIVTKALRDNGMSQAELAKKIGVGRSWMTKFFKGGIKNLSDDHYFSIQDTLGVQLATITRQSASALAIALAAEIEKDPAIEEAFNGILEVMKDDHYYDLPMLPTKDLVDFGKEIVLASNENPDKPGKVGRLAITWLAEKLQTLKASSQSKKTSG